MMPQELHVVRCCNCETFQSDIVKKIPKWQCKMCNTKQSLQKVYHIGSGKECRQVTQELNYKRFEAETIMHTMAMKQEAIVDEIDDQNEHNVDIKVEKVETLQEASKWDAFLPDQEDYLKGNVCLTNAALTEEDAKPTQPEGCDYQLIEPQDLISNVGEAKIKDFTEGQLLPESSVNVFEDPDEDISHLLDI